MSRFLFFLFLLFVILFGLTFAVENAHTVQFNFYFGSAEIRLSVLLVGALIAGAVIGVLIGFVRILALGREVRLLKRREAIAQQEVQNLRAIPMKDSP